MKSGISLALLVRCDMGTVAEARWQMKGDVGRAARRQAGAAS